MADNNEFYRLNLVLKMDDRLSKAMSKADSLVAKFEKNIQKTQKTVEKFGGSNAEAKVTVDTSKAEAQIERTNRLLEQISNKIIKPKVEAEDRTSAKVNAVHNRLQGLTSRAWKVTVGIKDEITGKLGSIKNAMASPLGIVGMGAATMGIGSLVASSANEAMNFSAEISNIKALTQLPQGQIDQIRAKAMQLGKDTQFSTLEAAKGMTELLKAGIDVKDVMGGASQAMLDLAAAGDLELPEAAEIMSTAMNAFNLTDPTHAANILAGAANASATDVHELRYALAACSAVAAGVGMSFDDTNTALAVFAQKGLKGSDAGTSLKTMLSRLEPMTKSQYAAFSELNLLTEQGTSAFYDQAGKMKSLADIADLLHGRMKDLTNEQQQRLLYDMFGSDAIRGGMILLRTGADGVKKMHEAMKRFTASEVAIEKMNNAKGAVERMKGSFENFQVEALAPMEPVIAKIANSLDALFDSSADKASGKMKNVARGFLYFIECLENNEAFQNMDWGDQVVYVLDRMMEAIDKWASGPGGEQFGKVMTKLAEIGMRAFLAALLGMMKGSLNALMHGNIAGAAGLAMGASFLGAGALLGGVYKGAKGLGGLAVGGSSKASGVYEAALALAKENGGGAIGARLSAAGFTIETSPLGRALSGAAGFVEKFGKRIAVIGAAIDGYRIFKSDNKLQTGAEVAGGWGGAFVGGKMGAMSGAFLGSFVGPLGTAIGSALGGIAGAGFGYFEGGEAGDWLYNRFFGKANTDKLDLAGNVLGTVANGQQNKIAIDMPQYDLSANNGKSYAFNMDNFGQNTSGLDDNRQRENPTAAFDAMQFDNAAVMSIDWTKASVSIEEGKEMFNSFVTNFCTGAREMYSSLSNWISNAVSFSIERFDSFVAHVKGAMQEAKQAVWDATPAPVKSAVNFGLKIFGNGHAQGGIFNQEHIARFAEGGKAEAVVPLDASMRSQGLSIWQQAGQMLGIDYDLFANMGESGFMPAMAMSGGIAGEVSNGGDNNNFNFNGLNLHVGNNQNDDEMAMEIGRRILAEIRQSFENRE